MRTVTLAGLMLLPSADAFGQLAAGQAEPGQAFEVASVKVS
jgi:hypothetical protein